MESIEHPEHYVTANDDGYLLLSDSDPALVLFPSLPGVSVQRMEKVPVKKCAYLLLFIISLHF